MRGRTAHLPHHAIRDCTRCAPEHSRATKSRPPCSHGLDKTAQRLRRYGVREGDASEFREIVVADVPPLPSAASSRSLTCRNDADVAIAPPSDACNAVSSFRSAIHPPI